MLLFACNVWFTNLFYFQTSLTLKAASKLPVLCIPEFRHKRICGMARMSWATALVNLTTEFRHLMNGT